MKSTTQFKVRRSSAGIDSSFYFLFLFQVHMIQGHRIPEGEVDMSARMLSQDFSIIFDETKLTAKCNLCFKKFTREKIYNHLRYLHHSSSHQVSINYYPKNGHPIIEKILKFDFYVCYSNGRPNQTIRPFNQKLDPHWSN